MATNWSIYDYGLTAMQLEEKYENRGEHHTYDRVTFHREVAGHGIPDESYWPWVVLKLQEEQDELDNDNPFN